MKKFLLLAFIIVGALASCKKEDPKPADLTAITLSKDTLKMNVGDTKSISFTLAPSTYDKTKLVWQSSDNTIISVDNSGLITAKKEGQAIVSVHNPSGTVTTFCLVSVLPELKAITLSKDTLKMNAGDVKNVNFTLTPLGYDKTALVWHSSDSTILTVSNSGAITAIKEGEAIVSVRNQGATITSFCLVSVAPRIDNLAVGLIAYYPFNDSGLDASGHKNDGTVFNISSAPNRHGNANSAYHFDGSTSYISVADKQELRLNNTDFTINAWINIETYNSYFGSIIFCKRLTGADNGWAMSVGGDAANPIGSINFGPGGGSINATGNKIIPLNQWLMVTTIYKAATSQLSIYVNGVLDNTSAVYSPNSSINSLMYIGKDDPSVPDNGYFFQGSMDELRIYNRAINPDELQKLLIN
ncbi:MAG: 5-Nucleotidase domain protein [Mucilaginibacter sp.]|nr:5-Nucleotidase domain protein [Mucilaginibacter sp.]